MASFQSLEPIPRGPSKIGAAPANAGVSLCAWSADNAYCRFIDCPLDFVLLFLLGTFFPFTQQAKRVRIWAGGNNREATWPILYGLIEGGSKVVGLSHFLARAFSERETPTQTARPLGAWHAGWGAADRMRLDASSPAFGRTVHRRHRTRRAAHRIQIRARPDAWGEYQVQLAIAGSLPHHRFSFSKAEVDVDTLILSQVQPAPDWLL